MGRDHKFLLFVGDFLIYLQLLLLDCAWLFIYLFLFFILGWFIPYPLALMRFGSHNMIISPGLGGN